MMLLTWNFAVVAEMNSRLADRVIGQARREQAQHLELAVGQLLAGFGAAVQRPHHGGRAARIEGALPAEIARMARTNSVVSTSLTT